MGQKSADLLRLIPDTQVDVVERCSGHGGTFGIMKQTRPAALKVGQAHHPAGGAEGQRRALFRLPLACKHIGQMLIAETGDAAQPRQSHPIEIFARAYGLQE